MADGVVSFLLEKLSNLLSSKYTQLEGLERDVQYIMDELESMRGFLRNAEAKQDYGLLDHEQQAWIKQVRETAYDMEDVVDEFLLHFAHQNHGETGFCCNVCQIYTTPVKNLPSRNRISSKIKDIKGRVEHIAANHQRYQSTEGIVATNTSHEYPIRGHALLLPETDLVGIFEPKREIISLILKDNSHAISVVGMGGLGKTTLVKRIYETPDIKNAFSIHAWLTISQTLRIDVVLKDLIRQIQIHAVLDSMDADGLRALVRDFLKEKRYIIVIDDLWELDQWDFIKYVFPYDDNYNSCIIITTRNEDVATRCSKQFLRGKVYKMMPLSMDDSLSLFCKKTFGEESCPPHLKSMVNNILTKCGGLPLGIAAIGGLLALKDINRVGEWDLVLRSLGSELEGIGKLTPVTRILFLSYNELPYYLKSCLLYMCIFPEDKFIHTEELTFLWIAEGFVEVKSGMTAREVAVSYLNELICRSLIQVAYKAEDGRVITCRVHDLVYEMNLSKCKEHNILTTFFSTPYMPSMQKIRRLVLDKVDDFTSLRESVDMVPLLHLRSLIIKGTFPPPILPKAILYHPKLLKVLDITSASLSSIQIKKIFELSNLTYLNLKSAYVTYIPKSIRKLQNLEYFIPPSPWLKLPIDIIKLKKLRYLTLNNAKAPYGLGGLSSLEYLTTVEVDSKEVVREIGKLIQLRMLSINGNFTGTNGMELWSSLQKLTNLRGLHIRSQSRVLVNVNPLSTAIKYHGILDLQYSFSSTLQYLESLTLEGPLVKVPDWVASCLDLSYLWLSKSHLREDQLESLAGLPNLVQFTLIDDGFVGNMLHFKAGGFPKLKFLQILMVPSLKTVIFERGAISDLQTLMIGNCMLLEEIPVGIQYLTKLRTLKFSFIPSRLQNELRIKKMDGHLEIAHITEIYIRYSTKDGATTTSKEERL